MCRATYRSTPLADSSALGRKFRNRICHKHKNPVDKHWATRLPSRVVPNWTCPRICSVLRAVAWVGFGCLPVAPSAVSGRHFFSVIPLSTALPVRTKVTLPCTFVRSLSYLSPFGRFSERKITDMKSADVAIAGGGIIGLSTALELATTGRKVTVFDRREAMSEASRAAAGMLAGNDPENPPELRSLARLSLALYPEFLARVEALSGMKIPIRTTATLQGVLQIPHGATALSEAEIQALAPGANTSGWSFFLMEERSLDAWDLAESLPAAARAAGVDLHEHTSVLRAGFRNGGVELDTSAGSFSAGQFLNAAGAWASEIHGPLPTAPRKGHMLTAELPGPLQMHCVLRTPKVYIVPRGDGRYTIGPTVEDAGFDKEVDPERIHALFHKAVELWPVLRNASIAETWTGLRPGSGDGLPIIDATASRCWIATGHFKNGIMLGPATAHLLCQWIDGSQPEVDLSPFRIARFCSSAAASW